MKSLLKIKVLGVVALLWFVRCTDTGSNAGGAENALDALLLEKAQHAGYCQAAALQAEKNGNAEVATYLGEIAQEEQGQALQLSVLKARASKDTKKNLALLIDREKNAANSYSSLIALAKEEGNDSLSALLTQWQSADERHLLGLKGIRERVK